MEKIKALIIDYIILLCMLFLIYLIVTILSAIIGTPTWVEEGLISDERVAFIERKIMLFIFLICAFFYYGQPFKEYAQTIGDKIMKIKVVPEKRKRIGFYWGLLRTFCLAPILAIVGLVPLPNDPEKTILDKICFTRTVPSDKE